MEQPGSGGPLRQSFGTNGEQESEISSQADLASLGMFH